LGIGFSKFQCRAIAARGPANNNTQQHKVSFFKPHKEANE